MARTPSLLPPLLLPLLLFLWQPMLSTASMATFCPEDQLDHLNSSVSVIHASQCTVPPCTTITGGTVTLALPVMLSLSLSAHGAQASVELNLLDITGKRCSKVVVSWDKEQNQMTLFWWIHGGPDINKTFRGFFESGQHWTHLQVEGAGRQVTISQLKSKGRATPVILQFQDNTPSVVKINTRTRLGYSSSTFTFTKNHNWQPLMMVITILTAISVLMSVVVLVLAWWGFSKTRAVISGHIM